jgi:hypothetical protein
MINIKSGNISLNDNSFIVNKGLTKAEFLKSNLFKDVLSEQTFAFTSYYLKPQLIGCKRFAIVLYFNNNNLIDFLTLSMTSDENIPSWDSWSEFDELKKKDEHDKWLESNIGKPPYKYSWGDISSDYDPRSGSSIITVRYIA